MSESVDLLVVGGGTAGLVAAKTAAGFGASVLLAEQARTGGDCLWTGCVPSKALLHAANTAHEARHAAHLGVTADVRVDFAAVRAHVADAIATIEPVDSPDSLVRAGVRVVAERAVFTGRSSARVGDQEVIFAQAVIATGAAPVTLPGLDGALTSETIWDLAELPVRLLVVGAGSIGCELAQAFARLGSSVTIVEQGPRLLPDQDAEAAAVLATTFAAEGIEVRCGAQAADAAPASYDAVLVAVGRRPRSAELGLDLAGVELDERSHVRVDAMLRTSNPRIWAAGDVTAHPQFTHVAGVHASVVASNAVLGLRRTVSPVIPSVTFTSPEIASVGTTQAPRRGRSWTTAHTDVDRAVTDADTGGFTRLVLDRKGRVVGGIVVGPRAGESLAEITLAVAHGLRARELAAVTHPYPTYADGVWKAAIDDVQRSLSTGPVPRVTRLLARLRRWRLDR